MRISDALLGRLIARILGFFCNSPDGSLKLANPFPKAAAEFRQFPGSKNNKNDQQNKEKVSWF